MNPTLITAAELCEFLDQHPDVEARAILSRGKLLKAHEIHPLCEAIRYPTRWRKDTFLGPLFRQLVDRIMLRWATSGREANLQPNTGTPEGKDEGKDHRLASRPGAAAPAVPVISSSRPAGAQEAAKRAVPGTPAGRPLEVEWTFTRFPDGRIILEVPE